MIRMSSSTSRRNAPANARTCATAIVGFLSFTSASAYSATSSTSLDSLSANADSDLMVVGPVEMLDSEKGTFRVLGQAVEAPAANSQISIGSVVAVSGELTADGIIRAHRVARVANEYVPGATRVAVRGKVLAMNGRFGNLRLGELLVDYTASLHSLDSAELSDGAVVFVAGTQPVPGGVLVADGAVAGAADGASTMKRSIGGSDSMKRSIGGSDLMSRSIGGSDFAKRSIGGSDLMSRSIGGSDFAKRSVGGSDLMSRSIGGSDFAKRSIGGSDLTSRSIGGSDFAKRSIGGSDLASAITTEAH